MSRLTRLISRELADRGVEFASEVAEDDPRVSVVLRIPAAHPDVGDLLVWVSEVEITVGLDLNRAIHGTSIGFGLST